MRRIVWLLLLAGCSSNSPLPNPPPQAGEGGATPTPTSTATATPTPTSTPTPSASAPPPPPAPDPELPAGTMVLHVGDSMADALGKDLKRELEAVGVKNRLIYKEATYIPEWAGVSDKWGYRAGLAQTNPDLVIITLGGNELAMPEPQKRAEPIRNMVKAAGDRPCLWIAAPLWPDAKNTGLFEVIKQNCAPCIFVDTNAMLKLEVLSSDHVHPTLPERKRWAKFMIRWLRHNRDPNGPKPWSFKPNLEPPPAE